MHALKLICLGIIRLGKRVWFFPQSVGLAFKQRKLQIARDELEIERLDRIRNPSKYLGK